MAPQKRARRNVVEDEEPCGSGQSAESLAHDIASQPELLARAAASRGASAQPCSYASPATALKPAASSSAKNGKAKKRNLADLPGFADLKDGVGGNGNSVGGDRRKAKTIVAVVKLAKYMQGPNKGKYSGKAFYAINCAFEDNKAFQALVERMMPNYGARWFADWAKWAVHCPTAELALRLHEAIKVDRDMTTTASAMNAILDVTPYDEPAVKKPHFSLATSELQFETRADGMLPRSVMIVGNAYDFKAFLKERFADIRYKDLVLGGGSVEKAAWILPVAAETAETGTLADFLRELGATVDEIDLDEDNDEDDSAERSAGGLIDDEAEEGASGEEEQGCE